MPTPLLRAIEYILTSRWVNISKQILPTATCHNSVGVNNYTNSQKKYLIDVKRVYLIVFDRIHENHNLESLGQTGSPFVCI